MSYTFFLFQMDSCHYLHCSNSIALPSCVGKSSILTESTIFFDRSQVFHVRSVTQGDVIRADAKDIPRIFQVPVSLSVKNRVEAIDASMVSAEQI